MPTRIQQISLPLGDLVLNALAAIVIATSDVAALRDVACLVVVFGTGVALVPLLALKNPALEATLVMLVSIVSLICVAQAVTYIAFFSWRPCEITLLAITAAGCAAQLVAVPILARGTT